MLVREISIYHASIRYRSYPRKGKEIYGNKTRHSIDCIGAASVPVVVHGFKGIRNIRLVGKYGHSAISILGSTDNTQTSEPRKELTAWFAVTIRNHKGVVESYGRVFEFSFLFGSCRIAVVSMAKSSEHPKRNLVLFSYTRISRVTLCTVNFRMYW
ncbi:uncharacterized protein BO96DRAFT_430330 [Aspergillus niger CBS 101883]|uniref:Uncharacterized protein n=2 Tax=Aspergillus niger TaxID=5061 RepID=A2QEY6_ASPNC|nr:uncharacterized protein BO96DRAFT_430330 [Aspergillus niger CBS 101883]XP_059603545.1 hypothetical protein An02g12660 [Aspergillus niger]PYH60390.1 hypothetical protein BO96DRAFT_430330 [Aspergillus niger CBS 101883]CAK44536.1 hypothetical protein An02g12660 [Aspergillus niger]